MTCSVCLQVFGCSLLVKDVWSRSPRRVQASLACATAFLLLRSILSNNKTFCSTSVSRGGGEGSSPEAFHYSQYISHSPFNSMV